MKTLLKSPFQAIRALAVFALLLFMGDAAKGQSTVVSDYPSFLTALKTSTVITNFETNATISLLSIGSTIQITNNVLIDGGTNGVVFDGNGVTRIFTIHSNATLRINNLQIINGSSTNGGAFYNLGTLVISNSIIAGNSATNISGVNGTTNTSGGNGGSASSGGSSSGGAIYSRGSLYIYNTVVGTNTVIGGTGGTGGPGSTPGFGSAFGGTGGNAGSGGSAIGAAIYSTGPTNVFVYTEFLYNTATGGAAGSGGASGGGAFAASGGRGAAGGSALGGAVYVADTVLVTNCVFWGNTATGGASGEDDYGETGFAGGFAEGGGIYIAPTVTNSVFENTTFFQNTCTGGAGGSASGESGTSKVIGGNGGSALGGGLASAASLTIVRNCTLATNTLNGGAAGTGSSGNGTAGGAAGFDICRVQGVIKMSGSIISGGTNAVPNPKPNAYSVTDAGYNFSSDASLVRLSPDTQTNTDPSLDSALNANGGPAIGPANVAGPEFLTLAFAQGGSGAAAFQPGVPGLSFPATDALGNPRSTPTSAGAFDLNPLTVSSNEPAGTIEILSITTNETVAASSTVTLSVEATNTDGTGSAVGYQWQLNGTNITDNATFSGTATSALTIRGITSALFGPYSVVCSPSLLETATTNNPPIELIVQTTLKILTQPVSKLKVPYGAPVTFTVKAQGTQPLTYQWSQIPTGGLATPLSDGNGILGSATSTLSISAAVTNDMGSYYVTVADEFGNTIDSKQAVLTLANDVTKPSIKFVSPAAGTRATNFVVTGTATDNAQVAQVKYWTTGDGNTNSPSAYSGVADLSTNPLAAKTWVISNGFSPGSNFVTVVAVDESGNQSAGVTREFFYLTPSVLTLRTDGSGTVKGTASVKGDPIPANNATLYVGDGYTLTATPAKGYVLGGWGLVDANGSNSISTPTLTFLMESNLSITANFVADPFSVTTKTYNGLFYDTSGAMAAEQSSGMLKNLTLTDSGAYTASVLIGGATYSLRGTFDGYGASSNFVKRTAAQGGSLSMEMAIDFTNDVITGVVSNEQSSWTATMEAEQSDSASPSAEFTVLLSEDPGNSGTMAPPGYGYLLVTNHNGSVTMSGALADGTAFSQTVPISTLGNVPVFSDTIYGGKGLLLGWLNLSNGVVQASNAFAWIKPAARTGIYEGGFTNLLDAMGSGWTNAAADFASLTDATLDITNANLSLTFLANISNNAIVQDPNSSAPITNSLKGTIAPKTGLMTITFGNGTGKATTVGYGVVLQNYQTGGGYFLTRTNAGLVLLTH